MGPHGYWPLRLGRLLLQAGQREDARGVAAQSGSDALALELAMSEARFDEAYREARTLVTTATPDRRGAYRAFLPMSDIVDDALVCGRTVDFADDAVKRYIDPDPPLLSGDKLVPLLGAMALCMAAPQPVGRRCITRLRGLFVAGHWGVGTSGVGDLMDGTAAYVNGDFAGAARAWRPLLRASSWNVDILRNFLSDAFDRAGEPDLAERVDARVLAAPGALNGADLAYVRAARRAAKRGDKATARRFAQTVVEAWSVADVSVPALVEMRALLASLKE
jgi:hypothetical protein